MILLTGGLPKSGKTTISKAINSAIPQFTHIYAEKFDCDDAIESWKMAINELFEHINEPSYVIFDTCNANPKPLYAPLISARNNGHTLIYAYINRSIKECSKHIDTEIVKQYINKFKNNLDEIRSMVDHFWVIDNVSIKDSSNKLVKLIRKLDGGL